MMSQCSIENVITNTVQGMDFAVPELHPSHADLCAHEKGAA